MKNVCAHEIQKINGVKMAVTIKQIAEVAQVSRGTVDRALNHRPGVKAEVAARVRRIADDLGYKPDVADRKSVV